MLNKTENWTYEDNEENQNVNEVAQDIGKVYRIFAADLTDE